LEHNITFIPDESFVDFSAGSVSNSLLKNDILEQFPNMVVIKSISKSFGVPGLRLGILAGSNTNLIDRIRKKLSIWNINSFAEYFMQIFGKYEKEYHAACKKIIDVRTNFIQEISTVNYLRVIPSLGNYFLCEVLPPYTSKELTFRLLDEYDILIKDCGKKIGFENKEFIRVAVRSDDDNRILIKALKKLEKGNNK
jgi:histidinol-phosphate/aromatic aminotransferase/cobyric acid decarboxylase-like protein